MPLRSGPRHWGQSEVEPPKLADGGNAAAETHKHNAAMEVKNRDFIVFSLELLDWQALECR
jgi:hypothetical protein